MTDAPRLTPAKQNQRTAREARLAQALRDNLRRRKEQAHARRPAVAPAPPAAEPGKKSSA